MQRVLLPRHFLGLLGGQTRPAKFRHEGEVWVIRYPGDAVRCLRLASEFVGYGLARLIDVPVPPFAVFTIEKPVEPEGTGVVIPAGEATGSRFLEAAWFPDLEREALPSFWGTVLYLTLAAATRVLDTWIMNFDRRRAGNVALRGDPSRPEVFFLDFDQSFLAKHAIGGHRPHWTSAAFRATSLEDTEVLSGFDGSGGAKNSSLQRHAHFQPALERLAQVAERELKVILDEIPHSWGVTDQARRVWLDGLLRRREIALANVEREYGSRD